MTPLRQLWVRWKMLRLPWRKTFLIGEDLSGNTYWEFKDALNHNRMRRIVKGRGKVQHSDVQIPPQWHQWLRQTRIEPPTIQEQHGDMARLIQLKHNARLADERWAAKAKYIESPQELPRGTEAWSSVGTRAQRMTEEKDARDNDPTEPSASGNAIESPLAQNQPSQSATSGTNERIRVDDDPWEKERQRQKQNDSNQSGEWQPQAWNPGQRKR